MTLSSTTRKVDYNGDGSTTEFTINFKFLDDTDIVVTHTDANGTETTWTDGTQYILSGAGNENGGTLTVETAPTDYTPASGETLTIKRTPTLQQFTSLPASGPFPSAAVEEAFDRLYMVLQSADESIGRAPQAPSTTPDPGPQTPAYPLPAPEGNKIIGWNADGDALENKSVATEATGDVNGPGSATDNAIVRFNGAGGKTLQNSTVTIDDSGNIATSGTVDGRDVSDDGTTLDALLVDSINFDIPNPEATTVTLDEAAPFAYTINTLTVRTDAGDIDGDLRINNSNVTGLASLDIDTTQDTFTATAANSVSAGDRVTLVLTNPSSPTDPERLTGTLKITRT